MNEAEFNVYQTLIADQLAALDAAGDVRGMSPHWTANYRLLNDLKNANQALHDFHQKIYLENNPLPDNRRVVY